MVCKTDPNTFAALIKHEMNATLRYACCKVIKRVTFAEHFLQNFSLFENVYK